MLYRFKLVFVLLLLSLSLFACAPVNKIDTHKKAEVKYKLALAHLQGNNPTMALRELLDAVRLNPQNSSIQVALAQTYQHKKAYYLAEKHYLIALELSPGEPRYQNNLASLYLVMEQWDKAILYFEKASKNLLFDSAHVSVAGMAFASFQKKDFEVALKYISEAITIAPRYASAYSLKSSIYGAMGEKDQEKRFLIRAIEIAPQFMRARFDLAVLLLQENLVDDAIVQLEVIVEFSETSDLGYKAKKMLKSISGS